MASLKKIQGLPPTKILLPNEHGAWGMLATAFLIGWLGTVPFSWHPFILLPAAVSAFLVRYPIGLYLKKRRVSRALKISLDREKKWFLIYGFAAIVTTLPLFIFLKWWWLLPIAFFSLFSLIGHWVAIIQRKERTFFVEWAAMVGISFLVLATSRAGLATWGRQPFILWILFVVFFTERIAVIRKQIANKRERPVNLKKLGQRELWLSLLFVVAVALLAHSPIPF